MGSVLPGPAASCSWEAGGAGGKGKTSGGDRRPLVAESKTARRERGAPGSPEATFSRQMALPTEVNNANPTFSLCGPNTLTWLFSEGRMAVAAEGKEELRVFPHFSFCPPFPTCLPQSPWLTQMSSGRPLSRPLCPPPTLSWISLCHPGKFVAPLSAFSAGCVREDAGHILVMAASCVAYPTQSGLKVGASHLGGRAPRNVVVIWEEPGCSLGLLS